MPLIIQGGVTGANLVEVDTANNMFQRRARNTTWGAAGGPFSLAGTCGSGAIVAAALAANTTLAAMRNGATKDVYISRLKFSINPATVGVSAGVPGSIAWQRFTTATPSGGTARTVARKDNSTGGATTVADARDSNAALTVTSVAFTDIFVLHPVPNYTTGGSNEYVTDFDEDEFIHLQPNDGICLRMFVAGPATMTWTFTYGIHWHEQ